MRRCEVIKYSECFKRQVVADVECGRFASLEAARVHFGIGGAFTIHRWLRRFGRNDLLPKVVRVEMPEEADRIAELRKQIAELQRALGQTQAENLLNREYLKLACQRLGTEVEAFKKKQVGKPCTEPPEPAK